MQAGPHNSCPSGQSAPQALPSHVALPPSGTGHGLHEVPQLAGSVLETHWSAHWCVPSRQLKDIEIAPRLVVPPSSCPSTLVTGPIPSPVRSGWFVNWSESTLLGDAVSRSSMLLLAVNSRSSTAQLATTATASPATASATRSDLDNI
jgi:hypothetical protein